MLLLSFISMYILMYVMVDITGNAYANINEFYMAGLMTSATLLIEVSVMEEMYKARVARISKIAGLIGLVLFFYLIRTQAGVGDKQFLESMIPHHASALLMCQQAKLDDPEIKKLCQNIMTGQQSEIDWMKNKLESIQ